jgi:predicted lipase
MKFLTRQQPMLWFITDFSNGESSPKTRKCSLLQTSWLAVATIVMKTLQEQIVLRPDHSILAIGHSLGGAIASMACVTFKQIYPRQYVGFHASNAQQLKAATMPAELLGCSRLVNLAWAMHYLQQPSPTCLGFRTCSEVG